MSADYHKLVDDPRYIAMKRGLDQLRSPQIQKILDHLISGKKITLDTYNYDEKEDSWCPLAIGLGVPDMFASKKCGSLTDSSAKILIKKIGERILGEFSLNPLKGIDGQYFRENRLTDLKSMCEDILKEREAFLNV